MNFSELGLFMQITWIIAIISSALFAIKFVMTMIGLDADTDVDADVPDDADGTLATSGAFSGLNLFSLNGILAFSCVGSWATIFTYKASESLIGAIATGLGCGFAAMLIIAILLRTIIRLQASGTVNMKNAVGMIGEVYLTIPAFDKGMGKVNLSLGGKTEEYKAICMDPEPIKTGTRVRVVELREDDVVVVQKESEGLE